MNMTTWCVNCGEYTMDPEIQETQVVGQRCTECMVHIWKYDGGPTWGEDEDEEDDDDT